MDNNVNIGTRYRYDNEASLYELYLKLKKRIDLLEHMKQGAPGELGDVGPEGPTGPQGIMGDKGEKGDTGDKGASSYIGGNGIIVDDTPVGEHEGTVSIDPEVVATLKYVNNKPATVVTLPNYKDKNYSAQLKVIPGHAVTGNAIVERLEILGVKPLAQLIPNIGSSQYPSKVISFWWAWYNKVTEDYNNFNSYDMKTAMDYKNYDKANGVWNMHLDSGEDPAPLMQSPYFPEGSLIPISVCYFDTETHSTITIQMTAELNYVVD